jgi:hypothetical protein
MMNAPIARTVEIFSSRLQTLSRILGLAETQWREKGWHVEMLRGVRLADMYPLTHHVVFTCNEPNDFVSWCFCGEAPKADPAAMAFTEAKPYVQATLGRLEAAAPEMADGLLDRDKRIDLANGMFVILAGRDYVDDWLLPNFYFHLVTSYNLLRGEGVVMGKADYMAHLQDRVQRD